MQRQRVLRLLQSKLHHSQTSLKDWPMQHSGASKQGAAAADQKQGAARRHGGGEGAADAADVAEPKGPGTHQARDQLRAG